MHNTKQLSKEQILIKLTSLCAKSEYCKEDMRIKMRRWEVDVQTQEDVLDYLIKERYIDEERYANAFIRNKISYNKWGVNKVKQALYIKRISPDIYEPILNNIETNDYTETLLTLLKNKIKTVKAETEYERKGKLIRFALQRGFTMDQALSCIDKITNV